MGTQKKVGFTANSNIQGDKLIINNGASASVNFTFNGSSATTFVLPGQDGTSGQALKTDGAGNLSFGNVAASSSSSGSSGSSGISGSSGSSGTSGVSFFGVTSGSSGTSGISGSSGSSGISGSSGSSGVVGAAGSSGTSGITPNFQSFAFAGAGTTVTGTASETVAYTILIPANTFDSQQTVLMRIGIKRVNTNGVTNIKIYANTTANISGSPIQMAYAQIGATALYTGFTRNFWIADKTGAGLGTISLSTTTAGSSDIVGSTVAQSSTVIDWTTDRYIVVTLQNSSSSDITNISGFSLSPIQGIKGSSGSSGTSGSSGSSGLMGATGSVATYTFNAYVTDTTTITKLLTSGNWTSGKYTGTAITNTYQGQKYYSATMSYVYQAVADNSWVRTILS